MKWFKTLRARFAFWTASLILIVLIFFGGFVFFSMKQSLTNSINDFLSLSATQAISAVNIENGQINAADSLPESSTADLKNRGLTIRLLTTDGYLIQVAGPYKNLPIDPVIIKNSAKGNTSFSKIIMPNASPVQVYTAPVFDNQNVLGVIQVMQSLADLNQTLDRLLLFLLISIPVLLIIAAFCGYFLAARALATIDKITRTAQRISAEDLSARLNLQESDDEVGNLVKTFDGMLARLEEGFKREHQFTTDASHELRTPLAAMQAIINVTREIKRSPEEYETALDDLSEETDRLRTLTEDLLYIARGDAVPVNPHERVNLSNILLDVCESLTPMAESKKLFIHHEISNDLWINGDSDALIRAFVNLIDNSIKYTDEGGIWVKGSRRVDQSIEVSVSDTGRGILPDQIPHLFERFYRSDESRGSRGAGLGLAIVYEIVKAHSAKIEVNSQAGRGTVFTLLFAKEKNHPKGRNEYEK